MNVGDFIIVAADLSPSKKSFGGQSWMVEVELVSLLFVGASWLLIATGGSHCLNGGNHCSLSNNFSLQSDDGIVATKQKM